MLTNQDINNYGIVYTPDNLVDKILDLIPTYYFKDPNLKWLDIGAGNGAFSINLFNRLMKNLENNFFNIETRKNHIIKNMLFMIEIYPLHVEKLHNIFSNLENNIKANIINIDYLAYNSDFSFDFIIGNPPYNINGKLKTPTNNSIKKSDDGKQIYVKFVKKSLCLLKNDGFLNIIIPSLWLKPDKAGLYNILTSKKILKLHCLSTDKTQKLFNYKAQTPTCFFLLQNQENNENNNKEKIIPLFDNISNTYIDYILQENYPIPSCGISIINKLLKYINKYGYLKVYKTNCPSKKSLFSDYYSNDFAYKNVKTTILSKNSPCLIFNYSNMPQHYYNKTKLIMSHKMYGFPYLDISNNYGIATRDNYVIISDDYSVDELKIIQAFLSSKTALYIFLTTNYRMRYLERYAFSFIPNISKMVDFANIINLNSEKRDAFICEFFNFNNSERIAINNIKNYNFFV